MRKTFVLTGFDELNNNTQTGFINVFRERGYNIIRHTDETDVRNVRFITFSNNRPTVILDVFDDETRNLYHDIPAIHFRDDIPVTVREGEKLVRTLREFDNVMFGVQDEPEEDSEPMDIYEDEDDDYAPIVFSSHGGYYGYDEGLDML